MQNLGCNQLCYREIRGGDFPPLEGVRAGKARDSQNPADFLLLVPVVLFVLMSGAPASDFWEHSLGGAREEVARGDVRPILLWIPSGRADEPSPHPPRVSHILRVLKNFHLARARSDDVQEILRLYGVKRVPAVLLLDRAGNSVERWEGRIPADLWTRIDRAARRLQRSEEELSRALAAGRKALLEEDFPEALEAFGKVRSLARPGYPQLAAANRLELDVLSRGSKELREVLAREGIVEDLDLREDLLRIKKRFPHPEMMRQVDQELERIKSRAIAGKVGG